MPHNTGKPRMAKNFISEDDIEQAILQELHQHGFQRLNCYTFKPETLNDGSNRQDKRDVILSECLKAACLRLNPRGAIGAIKTPHPKIIKILVRYIN